MSFGTGSSDSGPSQWDKNVKREAWTGGRDVYDIIKRSGEDMTTGMRDVMGEALTQLLEGLVTGGVGARMPIINKAQEATMRAGSQAKQQTQEELAQTGQAGTPFGTRAMGETTREAELASQMVPIEMVAQFIQQMLGTLMGQPVLAALPGESERSQLSFGLY